MATNRYIGARYVPLFTGDWDNTKTYEPLSIVTYQGDSYTSRAYVPAGVAITNTTYWVKTANFNQQVADLDNRVDNVETKLNTLEFVAITGTAESLASHTTTTKDYSSAVLSNNYGIDDITEYIVTGIMYRSGTNMLTTVLSANESVTGISDVWPSAAINTQTKSLTVAVCNMTNSTRDIDYRVLLAKITDL